jgi:hypothetical protein
MGADKVRWPICEPGSNSALAFGAAVGDIHLNS